MAPPVSPQPPFPAPQAYGQPAAPGYYPPSAQVYPAAQNPYAVAPVMIPLVGVGGWLMFLVLSLTVFGPLLALFIVIFMLIGAGAVGNTSPDIARFALADSLVIIPSTVWGLITGIALWKIQPGAVRRAKTYMSFGSIGTMLLLSSTPYVFLTSSEQGEENGVATIIGLVVGIGGALLWVSYLKKSRRVAATYPQG